MAERRLGVAGRPAGPVVPGAQRVVVDELGERVERDGELRQRELAACALFLLLESGDDRAQQRPGDGVLRPGLDRAAVRRTGIRSLRPAGRDELPRPQQQIGGTRHAGHLPDFARANLGAAGRG